MNTVRTDGIEILVPRTILNRRKTAVREACLDYAALVDALPTASLALDDAPGLPLPADPHACRAWLARVIRALPTMSDMEANDGTA